MNKKNLHVLSNIIAAVESGGQIYSEDRDWTAYAGAGTNSSAEVTCTLGPYQAYGEEAQELVQYIRDKYLKVFRECDKDHVLEEKLDEFARHGETWVSARWNPDGKYKAVLIKLLATDAGHEASEYVFQERLKKYIARAEENGVKNVEGQMMWAEVQHLGGKSAVLRIFERFPKGAEYSCGEWLEVLKKDQADSYYKKNGVGSSKYWSRHVKCVEFIGKYADLKDGEQAEAKKETAMGNTADKIIERAAHYVGYREKNHASADMENFTADAGSGNFQKFQELAGAGNGDQWCQYFVDGIAVEVMGSIAKAKKLLCQTNSGNYMTGYTPDGSGYFKRAGRWYKTPQKGDVIYFYSSSMGRICHVGYVEKVDTANKTVYTIEGNTNSDGFTTNGGCVARHSYSYANVGGGNRVAGFGRPMYEDVNSCVTLRRGNSGDEVRTLQENLHLVGFVDCSYYTSQNFVDGDFGSGTEKSVVMLQEACGLEVDGIYGEQSDKALTDLVKKAKASSFKKTVAEFLGEASKVAKLVRDNGWKYGNAPALPSVYPACKMTSCDRFIDQVLFACGLTDVGNRNIGALEKYLLSKGAVRITDKNKIAAGDIIKFNYGHVCILGNKKGNMWERYDGGSNDRLRGSQPFIEGIDGFEAAYRLPFIDERNLLVKKGQDNANYFTGSNIDVDGIRGNQTTKCMIKCIQRAANLDWQAGLEEDGIIGPKTREALHGRYIKLNDKLKMVTAVEIICYCLGRDPKGVEYPGIFGAGLAAALGTQYLSGEDILKLVD